VAGLAYGVTGSTLLLVSEKDTYSNRLAAGCSAGISLGIYSKTWYFGHLLIFLDRSVPIACVGCVTLASLAAFSKKFDIESLNEKSEFLQELSRPLSKKDERR
jgi:hypothetical protein